MEHPWLIQCEDSITKEPIFRELESEDLEGYYGMVYLIVNHDTKKSYVGKKFFWSQKKRQVKGRKRRYLAESDWKTYYGSNKQLVEDMENGLANIERFVLKLCRTKTECAYYELKEQVDRGVLLTEDYYNEFIGGKIHGRNLRKS